MEKKLEKTKIHKLYYKENRKKKKT